ncbi:protein ANTI-SILENCING 1-like [Phoenix dactylifera]|uniref:Protein ANTI-SILENCING 1-like n=1 Tax=Phoenix dactylifera TaxID=42345 RepID=A0A8B9A304_PHODC|nr:protein ANTI-SILENCING 1-like [Phoenix dactylifera]XP_038980996.1 protein ANTI-SILENCING 1-like [Phoenix dactylifera]XP_038980997.1 protein ANTI-SILENCING 1-like [Phoenix dactylifera]XP_038980998.1 protein ANTI-SILENCING 1-like [Phoenix dactylifera]
MAHLEDQSNDDIQFHWGKKRGIGGTKKDCQFYESFTFDNVNYSLYDCVYLFKHGEPKPYIGKILKIWEQPGHKRVKILWFFCPNEIQNYLGDHAPLEKEIFLASGEGVGLSNVNTLEAIAGKCCVICTSKDERNRQPSSEELAMADYIFYRTFDVGSYEISEKIADRIAGVEVKYLLNWKEDQKPKFEANSSGDQKSEDKPSRKMTLTDDPAKPLDKVSSEKVKLGEKKAKPLDESLKKVSPAALEDKVKKADLQTVGVKRRPDQKPKPGAAFEAIGDEYQKPKFEASVGYPKSEDKPSKKMRLTDGLAKPVDKVSSGKVKLNEKKTETLDNSWKKTSPAVIVAKDKKADPQTLEVTRRPDTDRSKWFKGLPWEVRMKNADEQGTLVFIENFDRHYTSSEIEDIFYRAFEQSCKARVIQQATFQDPNYGQAYVIFRTKEAADLAVSKINMGCMMLPDGRPLICSKGMLKMPQPKSSTLAGHYSVKLKPQLQREEMRRAVSTSHCSQPNTIEYEMAMDWILLQEKSVRWWERLFKGHGYERKQGTRSLKLK